MRTLPLLEEKSQSHIKIIYLVHKLFHFITYCIRFCAGHKDSVSSLAFSTDGQLLASGSLDGIIQVWDIATSNLKCTLDGPGGSIEVRVFIVLLYIYKHICKD